MGFLRDRIAARHHQSSCQPCDSQPQVVQSPCAPQPLVYSTPYATMGGCQPCQLPTGGDRCAIPAMPAVTITDSAGFADERKLKPLPRAERSDKNFPPSARREDAELPSLPKLRGQGVEKSKSTLPGLTVEDFYRYDGSLQPGVRPEQSTDRTGSSDRTKQLERELRAARDEMDNLRKQIEQMRADQRALIDKMQQGIRPVVAPPGSQGQFAPPPVARPGQHPPFAPQPVSPPGQQPFQPGRTPNAVPPVGDIQPPSVQPGAPKVQPWEAPPQPAPVGSPGKVQPEVKQPVTPPGGPQPEVKQPVVAPPAVPVPGPQVKPEAPAPGKPVAKPKEDVDFVQRAVAENKRLLTEGRERKFEELKAPFERFMQGERERLTRAMDNNSKDHPEMTSANTSWLLSQEAEKLIKDSGFRKKIDDVSMHWGSTAVIDDENAVSDERARQWEQVRTNASNREDPNYEKKQGVLNEIMNGEHLYEGSKFGRMNHKRGDSPLRNNKLQWQIDAAEALVRVNGTSGISHDFSTRSIVRGLVGDVIGTSISLPVPEQARIKLLDAIVPMSKESGNPFLGANPKDTALVTVITALERSHASRRPESDFQVAAINKLAELDDVRGITILQKLAAESSSTQVRELAAKQAEALREKIKP